MNQNNKLPIWEERSIFTANLYNPAFLGVLIQKTIGAYQDKLNKDKSKQPTEFPFVLVFFILPLILYKDSASVIPLKNSDNGLWLNKYPEIKQTFNERLSQFLPYTQETLLFLLQNLAISITDDGNILLNNNNAVRYKEDQQTIEQYFKAANNLGRWLTHNTPKRIYQIFGIKP